MKSSSPCAEVYIYRAGEGQTVEDAADKMVLSVAEVLQGLPAFERLARPKLTFRCSIA